MNLRRLLRALMGVDDKPERTALAYSIGVFIGFSPLLGLHTILGVVLAFLFRLNRMAVLVGIYSNAPWWMVPFYGFAAWLGYKLLGEPEGASFPAFAWGNLFEIAFWQGLAADWRLLAPVFLGSFLLSLALALIAYPVSLGLLRRYRNVRASWKRSQAD
ncbi:MAG: DUF2062 domain-containing protein, partial [Acidobacteriota bacterium]